MEPCAACRADKHNRCPQVGCGCSCNAEAFRAAVADRAATRPRREQGGGKFGPRGLDGPEVAGIAAALMASCPTCGRGERTYAEIAAEHGVSYDQVRTVLRDLQRLEYEELKRASVQAD